MIPGFGLVVGSYFLKKWHDDLEQQAYLRSFFRIVILAIAVVIALFTLTN